MGGLHLGFVGKVRLVGVVEILLADSIDLCQRLVLLNIELALELVRFRRRELRLILNQLRPRLSYLALRPVECRLEWARVDLKEKLSFPDVRPFLEFTREEIAGDLCFHVGVHLSGEASDPFSVNRNISLLDRRDFYDG